MNSCIFTPVLRPACCGLSLGLLTLMIGCSSKAHHSADHAEVSGKVLFQGNPLPGGKVTFITVNGGFASVGTIDEKGNYQIKAPVGEVQISVTNRMLQSKRGQPHNPPKGASPSAKTKTDEKIRQIPPMKGRWVKIPSQYEDPSTSGLKYTVKPGPQTHDIELSDKPSPAPGVS